jgi:DNA-binding NarL/FixJ family response regulator
MDPVPREYTVMLVEDEYPVVQAVKSALTDESRLKYLGCEATWPKIEALVLHHAPDLVLADLQLPVARPNASPLPPTLSVEEGLAVIARIKKLNPQSRVIAYSNFFLGDPYLTHRAIESGADAVLTKQHAPSEGRPWGEWLRSQFILVAEGYWMPSAVVAELFEERERRREQESQPARVDEGLKLSKREREVLQLLAKGLSDREIAQELVIEPTTVRSHIRNIMARTHARSRQEAINRALPPDQTPHSRS